MRIVAIDDERLARMMLVSTIQEVASDAEIIDFDDPDELLNYAGENHIDIACLDIQIYEVSGIDIAKALQDIQKDINIIFTTAYAEYMPDAFKLHASGYLTKPISPAALKEELDYLRHRPGKTEDAQRQEQYLLRVQCFGNFDVFDKQDKNIIFSRRRSKEILAYLISLNGSSCTIGELAGILFEDEGDAAKNKAYTQKILSAMIRNLEKVGAGEVVRKSYNSFSVDVNKVACDYYRYLKGEPDAIGAYMGEFMKQYSWAEDIMTKKL